MKRISRVPEEKTTGCAGTSLASSETVPEMIGAPQAAILAEAQRRAWLRSVLIFAISSMILIWAFRPEILGAIDVWSSSSTFGHAFFILPIVLFLIYRLRHRLAALHPRSEPWALALIAAILLIWAIGHLANVMLAKQLAFVALWQSMFLLIFGWRVARVTVFPLAYLYLAVPFGLSIIPPLQDLTAQIVVHLLRLTGLPVFLDGYYIQIPSGNFLVAEACSGVRYLMVCLALGILAAYLFFRSWSRRILFLTLSAVVPIVANGVRAYGIIMIAHLSDYTLAVDIDHVIYGFIFLGIVMLCLLGLGALFRDAHPDDSPPPSPAVAGPNKAGHLVQGLCAGLALFAVFVVQTTIATANAPPAELVANLHAPSLGSAWQVVETEGEETWTPDIRGMDAQLQQSYRREGHQVDLHIAYYAYQREGAEAVSDLNRMVEANSGWQVLHADRLTLPIGSTQLPVNTVIVQGGHRTFQVWYWYWIGGENTNSRLTAKLLEMKALATGGDRAGAIIALASEVTENSEGTAALLRGFLQQALENNASLIQVERSALLAPAVERASRQNATGAAVAKP